MAEQTQPQVGHIPPGGTYTESMVGRFRAGDPVTERAAPGSSAEQIAQKEERGEAPGPVAAAADPDRDLFVSVEVSASDNEEGAQIKVSANGGDGLAAADAAAAAFIRVHDRLQDWADAPGGPQ